MQELLTILVVIYALNTLVKLFKGDNDGCGNCNCGSK